MHGAQAGTDMKAWGTMWLYSSRKAFHQARSLVEIGTQMEADVQTMDDNKKGFPAG